MRVASMLLGTHVAVSSCASQACEESDGSSLLQSRSLITERALKSDAWLESLRKTAKSLTKENFHNSNPDEVNEALDAAGTALGAMEPTFASQHESAQHQINNQFGEIEACHGSASHGATETARHEALTGQLRGAKEDCDAALVIAIERQVHDCDAWNELANQHLSHGLPACGPSTAEELYNSAESMMEWVTSSYGDIARGRNLCNAATEELNQRTESCEAIGIAFDEAFCSHAGSCHMLSSCHAHEVEVYDALKADEQASEAIRQNQFRTTIQATCLVQLITTAMTLGQPIDHVALIACDDVSIDHLVLNYPVVDQSPPECPDPDSSDPQCGPPPHFSDWENGQGVVDLSNIQPGEGSPSECRCSLVELQGEYSAGQLVLCEECLDTGSVSQPNSCPTGWKLFSPRNSQDWETVAQSVDIATLQSPEQHGNCMIVDVSRPENHCGGCTQHAMNSESLEQSSWTTSDGSPWWLKDGPYGEPNGDYAANCYLGARLAPLGHLEYFNDWNPHGQCGYHNRNYLCQPQQQEDPQPDCTCQVVNYLGYLPPGNTQGPPETVTAMNDWVAVRGGISSLDLTKLSGSGNCVLKVETTQGVSSHVYSEGRHDCTAQAVGHCLPTGNDNMRRVKMECEAQQD